MGAEPGFTKLLVLWELPDGSCPQADVALSFLQPGAEERFLRSGYRGVFINGREASREVRQQAKAIYIDLVAEAVVRPARRGMGLRMALSTGAASSRWWFHPVSFRDCEADPTFDELIAVMAIHQVAQRHDAWEVILYGAPREIATVLASVYAVTVGASGKRSSPFWSCVRGLATRALALGRAIRTVNWARRWAAAPARAFAVGLMAFWPWSLPPAGPSGDRSDPYFATLPARLPDPPIRLIWIDRLHRGAELRRLVQAGEGICLQSLVTRREVIREYLDPRPLWLYVRYRREGVFRAAWSREGFDFFPLFDRHLCRGFADDSLPRAVLAARGFEQAIRRCGPEAVLSFLEHFPHARALYEGARRAGGCTLTCIVQHAGYSSAKTFLFFKPDTEFEGAPDGDAVPHADRVYAMSEQARELFLECGYPPDRVVALGSPRYDHVAAWFREGLTKRGPVRGRLRVLLVGSLGTARMHDLVEAAFLAGGDIPGVELSLQSHPLEPFERSPSFKRYAGFVTVAKGALHDHIVESDLILFSASTAADEAFVLGSRVWQWAPMGYDGSPLAEEGAIPVFTRVADLRSALIEALQGDRPPPDVAARERILERLFGGGQGASERVADDLLSVLSTRETRRA